MIKKISSFLQNFWSSNKMKRNFVRLKLKQKFFSFFQFPKSWNIRVLHLELTSNCNLLCKACYRTGALKELMELNSAISKEDLQRIIQKYPPRQVLSVIISGGENLLRPDFFDLLKIIKSRFAHAALVLSTNGIILTQDPKKLEILMNSEITDLQVSLHGATQETISKLQNGVNLEKVLQIAAIIQKKSRINVAFNYVVQEENIEEMSSFLDVVNETGVKTVSFTPMNYAGHVTTPVDYKTLWDKWHLRERLQSIYEKAGALGISVPGFVPVCSSLFSVDVLTAEGEMLPCWGNYLVKKYSIGNVIQDDPAEIRNQKKMQELQAMQKNGDVPELCCACWANGKFLSYFQSQ